MPRNEHTFNCRHCGNQMHMTRFQSTVTDVGIDREQYYECLWCDQTDFVASHTPHARQKELAA
jgi:hypothetical protein